MHRFLPGILLLQFVTLLVLWLNLTGDREAGGLGSLIPDSSLLLRVLLPCLMFGVLGALWFAAISRHASERAVTRLKESHAKEREKLKVQVERDRTKMVEQTQKEIRKQTRRVTGKANLKVGFAFACAAAAGVVLIITELITLGIITMTTAGGAMGGYLLRGRQARSDRKVTQATSRGNRDYIDTAEADFIEVADEVEEHSGKDANASLPSDDKQPKLINPPESDNRNR